MGVHDPEGHRARADDVGRRDVLGVDLADRQVKQVRRAAQRAAHHGSRERFDASAFGLRVKQTDLPGLRRVPCEGRRP